MENKQWVTRVAHTWPPGDVTWHEGAETRRLLCVTWSRRGFTNPAGTEDGFEYEQWEKEVDVLGYEHREKEVLFLAITKG